MDTDHLAKVQLRKYMLKYDYLDIEYIETKMLFDEYNKKFLEEYYTPEELDEYKRSASKGTASAQAEVETEGHDTNEDADTNADINGEIPAVFKALYKKLSLLTHPDKVKGKEDTFKRINKAYNAKEYLVLVKIAMELDIDTSGILSYSPQVISGVFEKTIKGLEESIASLKQTLAWHWAHASDSEKELYRAQSKGGG